MNNIVADEKIERRGGGRGKKNICCIVSPLVATTGTKATVDVDLKHQNIHCELTN